MIDSKAEIRSDGFVSEALAFGERLSGRPPRRRDAARAVDLVYRHYESTGRSFPWRETRDPYAIAVSEVMLQQTQAGRVAERFTGLLEHFPTVRALARAGLRDVLAAWQGLGYNRRALYLKQSAERICARHGGRVPFDTASLRALPGFGAYTASAVRVFAFGCDDVLIETNIRTVALVLFFGGRSDVHDCEILPVLELMMDRDDPRRWQYALMDLGVALKRNGCRAHRRSAHYTRQSPFAGSPRELRGAVLRILTEDGKQTITGIARRSSAAAADLDRCLASLAGDGLVVVSGRSVRIAGESVAS